MPTPLDPLREQLIEARRAQILDAAAAVFAERGFHRTTIKAIAAVAGVAEGTIYNYFESKDALLIGLMARLAEVEHFDLELAQGLQDDPKAFTHAAFRQRLQSMGRGLDLMRAVLPEILVDDALQRRFREQYIEPLAFALEQYVQARIAQGQFRPLNARLVVRILQSTLAGLLLLRLVGEETLEAEWEQVPETLATLMIDGLGMPAPIRDEPCASRP
jgi:TetR/AcrR family fatty acid metabolism transcriptional regulator